MEKNSIYKPRISTFIVVVIICLLIAYINLLSHNKTQKIYLEQTEYTIIKLKEDFLRDTVNNVFMEIDALRKTKTYSYKKNTEHRLSGIQEKFELTDKEFVRFFQSKFNEDSNTSMWTAFLWNSETKETLYISPDLNISTIDEAKKELQSSLSSYSEFEKGNIKGIFGVKKTYIDDIVKKEIETSIGNRKFSNESYMWINEIINYEGGKDYAIRKVHPSLKSEEVYYLSTDMKDIKGNLPYLKELEGINENGEVISNYYFKKLNSSEISEKISYAKLYKDYNWIIAMGVHLDEIDAYTDKINDEISNLSSNYIMKLLRYIFVVLFIGFTILYLMEKKNFKKSTLFLEKEIDLDALTNAFSRKYGERKLESLLMRYKLTGKNVAIMMLDVDEFKQVNDQYGHESGDTVLKEIVKIISENIRTSDKLIRWGGDEFLGIFIGFKEENLIEFGQKILDEVSSSKIIVAGGTISISISIGFSYFKKDDKTYNDVLKRADAAMYSSKEGGKNSVRLE